MPLHTAILHQHKSVCVEWGGVLVAEMSEGEKSSQQRMNTSAAEDDRHNRAIITNLLCRLIHIKWASLEKAHFHEQEFKVRRTGDS